MAKIEGRFGQFVRNRRIPSKLVIIPDFKRESELLDLLGKEGKSIKGYIKFDDVYNIYLILDVPGEKL